MAMTRSIPLRTSCLYYRAALFIPPPPSSSPPPFIPFDKTACGFQEGYMKLLQVHRQSPASLYLRLNSPSLPLCLADVARSLPLVYSDAAEANIFRRLLETELSRKKSIAAMMESEGKHSPICRQLFISIMLCEYTLLYDCTSRRDDVVSRHM